MLFNFENLINDNPGSRRLRRTILVISDSTILFISFCIGLIINIFGIQNQFLRISKLPFSIIIFNLILGITFYILTNQYKTLIRFSTSKILYQIALRNFILTLFFYFTCLMILKIPISLLNIFLIWFLSTSLMSILRAILKDLTNIIVPGQNNKVLKKIGIYGAGSAAYLLANSLDIDKSVNIIAFFDDNKELWGRSICGKNIYSPKLIPKFSNELDYIVLAVVSLSEKQKNKIITDLKVLNLKVCKFPTLTEIKNQETNNSLDLNYFSCEELLGRDYRSPDQNLLGPSINNKVCCVTGAGGSIGRELVIQILRLDPKKLILFEMNEYALYSLIQEISKSKKDDIEIVNVLGDVTKKNLLREVLVENSVDVVFHAAAYKHVPLVEENPLTGIFNNIISTRVICKESLRANVEKVIFISTDKAVRPTNVMGASKRLGELIVQSYSELVLQKNKYNTIFSIVRFGNVLGSSGSVIPLFKKQILEGGPITLTHPDVIRYFMTIEEAVSLVLQASVLSKGGEVFLLDMGKPVKILDLAKQMIKLSGLTLRNEINIYGDIEIKIVGLRDGEKLYEELLIDGKAEKTEHSLIFKVRESFIPFEKLSIRLDILEEYLVQNKTSEVLSLMQELVPEWNRRNKLN